MKKSLLALFIAAVLFTGCQKDTSTKVNITNADLTQINGQLKGTWLFPVETLSLVDSSGKSLQPVKNLVAPALQFDGSTGVNIMTNSKTSLKGTYKLSTTTGGIYVDVNYPNGTTSHYQVILLTDQMLKLTSTQSYVEYQGSKSASVNEVTTTILKKQTSADVTSNMLRVIVSSDSVYNVKVYITHPNDTAMLMNSQSKVTGAYAYSVNAKSGDGLTINVFGSTTNTAINAYYNGVPFGAAYQTKNGEIITSGDWVIH